MSTASTPWSTGRAGTVSGRPVSRPAWWPWFAALALFLMGIGATLSGISGPGKASSRPPSAVTVSANQQQAQALSARLAGIEAGLAALPVDRVAAAAALTCTDLQMGVPSTELDRRTAARFGGEGYLLSDQQAGTIVAAVQSGYCGTVRSMPGE